MRARRFEWAGAAETARALRAWAEETAPEVDVAPIEREVREERDAAVLRLTSRFDAPAADLTSLRIGSGRRRRCPRDARFRPARSDGSRRGQRPGRRRGPARVRAHGRAACRPERQAARGRGRRRRDLLARGPRRISLLGPDVRDPGPGGRRRAPRPRLAARARRPRAPATSSPPRRSAASTRSMRWAARRRSSPSPTGPRRSPRSTSSPARATPGCGRPSAPSTAPSASTRSPARRS